MIKNSSVIQGYARIFLWLMFRWLNMVFDDELRLKITGLAAYGEGQRST
jgi:hypothetical protein